MTGTSAKENLEDVLKLVQALADARPQPDPPGFDKLIVLDVGAGEGTYADALGPIRGQIMLEAVEIWGTHLERLRQVYDNVWAVDIRDHLVLFNGADVVIFGDVLEHMTVHQAHLVWERARQVGATIIVSVPNSPYPQGALDGNHYEEHLILDPVTELIADLPVPDDTWEYPVTNTYIWNGTRES